MQVSGSFMEMPTIRTNQGQFCQTAELIPNSILSLPPSSPSGHFLNNQQRLVAGNIGKKSVYNISVSERGTV